MRRTRWADASDRKLLLHAALFGLAAAVAPALFGVLRGPAPEGPPDVLWTVLPYCVVGGLAAVVFGLLIRSLRKLERAERRRNRAR